MTYTIAFDRGYKIWSAGDDAPLAFLTDRLRQRMGADTRFQRTGFRSVGRAQLGRGKRRGVPA